MIDRLFWKGKRVLLTGHTGFKGSWASLVLKSLGADVYGFSQPPTDPRNLFFAANLERDVHHRIGDIRDSEAVQLAMIQAAPDIVIHMAAQPLVRASYATPVYTYATNVMGTVHVLESARHVSSVRAVVIVTSDKCYENTGSSRGYREADEMGGHDPYSNSKGCAELVTSGYRRSFFGKPGAAQIATGRAGNVIGGGDWSADRLLPDAIRSFIRNQSLRIRHPEAVRPWQHVLDPIIGYLRLAEHLVAGEGDFAEGWNFGPSADSEVPVRHIVDKVAALWGNNASWELDGEEHLHEASYLRLDCSKAATRLGWRSTVDLDQALQLTVDWYHAFQRGDDLRALTLAQIEAVLGHSDRSTGKIEAPAHEAL